VNIIRIAVAKTSDGRIVAVAVDATPEFNTDGKAMTAAIAAVTLGREAPLVWRGFIEGVEGQ
jgi:hypothetical protein